MELVICFCSALIVAAICLRLLMKPKTCLITITALLCTRKFEIVLPVNGPHFSFEASSNHSIFELLEWNGYNLNWISFEEREAVRRLRTGTVYVNYHPQGDFDHICHITVDLICTIKYDEQFPNKLYINK